MIVLDAPMGTRLIDEHGLKPEDVLMANLAEPNLVRALHRRDVEAGAEIVLTNTFALPFRAHALSDAEIEALVIAAVEHAYAAQAKAVHLSLGPVMLKDGADRAMLRVLTCALAAVKRTRACDGIWFESLSAHDCTWLVNVMSALSGTHSLVASRVAASFLAGDPLPDARRLDQLWALGFNCSRAHSNTDAHVLDAAQRWLAAPLVDGQMRIAKPAAPISREALSSLARAFDLVGVCCGGTSDDLRAIATAREPHLRSQS
jgi:hypothetical protein